MNATMRTHYNHRPSFTGGEVYYAKDEFGKPVVDELIKMTGDLKKAANTGKPVDIYIRRNNSMPSIDYFGGNSHGIVGAIASNGKEMEKPVRFDIVMRRHIEPKKKPLQILAKIVKPFLPASKIESGSESMNFSGKLLKDISTWKNDLFSDGIRPLIATCIDSLDNLFYRRKYIRL